MAVEAQFFPLCNESALVHTDVFEPTRWVDAVCLFFQKDLVGSPSQRGRTMKDTQAQLRLLVEAANCERSASKRELFAKLTEHYKVLAGGRS
jgi:hypothetical protein